MNLTGKQRAELIVKAHNMPATLHVGKQGITPNVIESLEQQLEANELVKVALQSDFREERKELAAELTMMTDAILIQTKGKTALLYRENTK